MNIDDSDQLECEKEIIADQGVDIEQEKQNLQRESKSKKPSRYHNRKHGRNWGILIFTMFMPIQAYILQYFYLWETLKENIDGEEDGEEEEDYYGFAFYMNLIFMLFICAMNFQTYYYCIFIKNTPLDKPPMAQDANIEDNYQNNKTCNNCKKWKPLRTSHCSSCGQCTMKMDHHCPWIDNCVGLKNHKAFLLFTFYMNVGACQYFYHTIQYFRYLNSQDNFFAENSILFYMYWTIVSFIILPMNLMLFGLTIFHSVSAQTNMTTLQNMAGAAVTFPLEVDQDPKRKKNDRIYINIYDQGICKNLYDFFMGQRFTFWIGDHNIPKTDGSYYETNPDVTRSQMMRFQLGSDFPAEYDAKILESEVMEKFENEINTERLKYENRPYMFNNRVFQLEAGSNYQNAMYRQEMIKKLQQQMDQQSQNFEQMINSQRGEAEQQFMQELNKQKKAVFGDQQQDDQEENNQQEEIQQQEQKQEINLLTDGNDDDIQL